LAALKTYGSVEGFMYLDVFYTLCASLYDMRPAKLPEFFNSN